MCILAIIICADQKTLINQLLLCVFNRKRVQTNTSIIADYANSYKTFWPKIIEL